MDLPLELFKSAPFFAVFPRQMRRKQAEGWLYLLIDRKKLTFEEKNEVKPGDWGLEAREIVRQEFQCFLGISARHHSHFLLLATALRPAGTLYSLPLYSVTAAAVLPYSPQPLSQAARRYAEDLKAYLESGSFYLALEYALSMSLRENKEGKSPFQGRFCWNEQFCRRLDASIQRNWLIPVIKGFAGSAKVDKEVEIVLISRRSFSSAPSLRGLPRDSEDCGYSVETEVIVKAQSQEFSFLQLRGTLPVPWEASDRGVGVSKQPLSAYPSFKQYWSRLLEKYGEVAVLNLLNEERREQRLTQAFTQLLNQYRTERTEGLTYQTLSSALELGDIDSSLLGFTVYAPGNRLICGQRTVPRVNCLDCLERTETVMEGIAQMQLAVVANSLGSSVSRLQKVLTSLWTRNASALKTTQNRDFQLEPSLQSDFPALPTVRICSWNLAGLKPPKGLSLQDWLGPERNKPVLIAVGLQEVVRLTAMNSLNLTSNFGVYREWSDLLFEALNEEEMAYSALTTVHMVGCFLAVFVLNEWIGEVSDLETDKIQAGFGSYLGNKGAVAVRLKLRGRNVCFLNCHLASGQENVGEREEQATKILKDAFRSTENSVLDHDIVYLFGDLNFRINLPTESVFSLLRSLSADRLVQHDQLSTLRRSDSSVLSLFSESPLSFMPTYKFSLRDDLYDRKRTPSWTDRILYYGPVIPANYHSSHIPYSDHRPISLVTSLTP